MKKIANFLCSLLLAGTLTVALSGCEGGNANTFNGNTPNLTTNPGGTNSGTTTTGGDTTTRRGGRATLSVRWPERTQATRLIPQAAESIVVTLTGVLDGDGNPTLSGPDPAPQTLVRPNPGEPLVTTTTFDNLELGNYIATAVAYPNPDGTGTPLATATTTVTIPDFSEGIPTIRLTLASTAVSAELSLAPTGDPFPFLLPGDTNQLAFVLRDSTGAQVLVAPGQIIYSSDNPNSVTVDTNGLVTAVADGGANITARDPETGLTASIPVFVFLADRAELRNTPVGPVSVGNTFTISSVILNASGTTQLDALPPVATVTYTNSNPTVATLNAATGAVVAVSAGTTDIQATVTFEGTDYVTPVYTLVVAP